MNDSKSARLCFFYFATGSLVSLLCGVRALFYPSNLVASFFVKFSELTLGVFAWFFAFTVMFLLLAWAARKKPQQAESCAAQLTASPPHFWAVQSALVTALVLALRVLYLSPEELGGALGYFWRLQPVLAWLALISALSIGWLSLLRFPDLLQEAGRILTALAQDGQRLLAALKPAADEKKVLYALAALTLIAVASRLAFIDQPLRSDEARSFIQYASKTIAYPLTIYDDPNNHVFHNVLMSIAYHTLGRSLLAIRLAALLAGILTIPAGYLAARALFDANTAILSAAFLAASTPLILYSTNGRGYSMIVLFTLVICGLGAVVKKQANRAAWVLLAVTGALGFFTIPIMLYPFGALMLWLFLSALSGEMPGAFYRRLFFAGAAAAALTTLLYLPILWGSGIYALIANQYVTPGTNTQSMNIPGYVIELVTVWSTGLPAVLTLLLGAGLLASIVLSGKMSAHRLPLPLVTAVWCAALMLAQRVLPFQRVLLFLLPLCLIYACAGLIKMGKWLLSRLGKETPAGGAAILLSLALAAGLSWDIVQAQAVLHLNETGTLRDAVAISEFIRPDYEAGIPLLSISPNSSILRYYTLDYQLPAHKDEKLRDLVVNTDFGQTLDSIGGYYGFTPAERAKARLLKKFNSALIYRLEKE